MPSYGKTVGKILELLAAGFVIGFIKDKTNRRKLLAEADDIWYSIDRKQLIAILERFKLAGLVKILRSGSKEKLILTTKGKQKFLAYKFHNLKQSYDRKQRWDGKWRMVLFDIPEGNRKIRDALRKKLKTLGFLEFQKSVFIFPYRCDDEINFIINFFNIEDHVYYIETQVSPDLQFRKYFKLN